MPAQGPSPLIARTSDRRLQLLGNAEGDFLRGLDLDRLAGLGIDSHAGLALTHLEDAQGGQTDAVALLEVLADGGDERFGELVRGLLRHAVLIGQASGELALGDGRLLGYCHGRSPKWMNKDQSPVRFGACGPPFGAAAAARASVPCP